MIPLYWDREMVLDAVDKAARLGRLNNSITRGAASTAAYLGENAIANHLGGSVVSCDHGSAKYNHDILHDGRTVEVKTKRRTCKPKSYYDVSVAKTSMHQSPDIYAFLSIEFKKCINKVYYNPVNVWLCGFCTHDFFIENARYIKEGSLDRSNGFVAHADMYNLPISKLSMTIKA